MEEIIDNKRYRNFMILFYNENEKDNFDNVIFNIHFLKYYAYIKHLPEDDEKKEHYHAFIRLDSACTEEALAKRLELPLHLIQHVKNVRGGVRYLTHIDYPDKIQYCLEDVTVSGLFTRQFNKCFQDVKTEEEIIQDIYNWIDNAIFDTYQEKLKNLVIYVNYNVYDTIFKRYRYEFLEYLKSSI